MKTLADYLRENIERDQPHSVIDHTIRAELHQDGRISFYIHPSGVDGETLDFWIVGNDLKSKQGEAES